MLWIKEAKAEQWLYNMVAAMMKEHIKVEVLARMKLKLIAARGGNASARAAQQADENVMDTPSTRVFAVLHLLKALCINERVFVDSFQKTTVQSLGHFYEEFKRGDWKERARRADHGNQLLFAAQTDEASHKERARVDSKKMRIIWQLVDPILVAREKVLIFTESLEHV